MITFDEFLITFNEEIQETFEATEMTENAKLAVVTVMRRHLRNRIFDPLELMELFETVCISATHKDDNYQKLSGIVGRRFRQEAPTFLTEEDEYYSDFPEISFDELAERRATSDEFEERRAIGR